MRRTLSQLVGVAMVGSVLFSAAPMGMAWADPGVVAGSYIVTLHETHDPRAEAGRLSRQHGGEAGHVYEAVLNGFQFKGSEQGAASLARNPKVRTVVADRLVHAVGETVPTGVTRIDADDAHTGAFGGSGVAVAVIDTGIDLDHPDLQARIDTSVAGKDCVNGDNVADDDNGHGSHVAGTVAAARGNDQGVVGVAHAASLVPVKVLDANGSGSWAGVICGVDHVTANATAVEVANMSLGGSGSEGGCTDGGLHQAICESVTAGVAYTVAAGNDSEDAAGHVPASYDEVITVSAYSDTDGATTDAGCTGFPWTTCDEEFAPFSNYGADVDLIAPGVKILSTVNGGGYDTYSGTSMAAPHVAGVAALAIAAHSLTSPQAVKDHLQATGVCPDKTSNGSAGNCALGTGDWKNDPDSVPEPFVNAATATAGGTTDSGTVVETGTLSGTVTNAGDGTVIGGATVAVDGTTLSATTDGNGNYSMSNVPTGTYSVTASASGYDSLTKTGVQISTGAVTDLDFALVASSTATSISLTASGYKVKGVQHSKLDWTGATAGGSIDVYSNGYWVSSDSSDSSGNGTHDHNIGKKGGGSYTYKVCEAGSTTKCSNEATVTF